MLIATQVAVNFMKHSTSLFSIHDSPSSPSARCPSASSVIAPEIPSGRSRRSRSHGPTSVLPQSGAREGIENTDGPVVRERRTSIRSTGDSERGLDGRQIPTDGESASGRIEGLASLLERQIAEEEEEKEDNDGDGGKFSTFTFIHYINRLTIWDSADSDHLRSFAQGFQHDSGDYNMVGPVQSLEERGDEMDYLMSADYLDLVRSDMDEDGGGEDNHSMQNPDHDRDNPEDGNDPLNEDDDDDEDEDEDDEDEAMFDDDEFFDSPIFGFPFGGHSSTAPREAYDNVETIHPRRMFRGARNVETVKDCTFPFSLQSLS